MSPEIMDNKKYNSKTDVWSLGVVLYEIMCLKLPFQGSNIRQLCVNIMRSDPVPPSSAYSSGLRELLKSMLLKQSKLRPGINSVLGSEVVRRKISNILDDAHVKREFSHTVLHGENILHANYKPPQAPPPPPTISESPSMMPGKKPEPAKEPVLISRVISSDKARYQADVAPEPLFIRAAPVIISEVVRPQSAPRPQVSVVSRPQALAPKQPLIIIPSPPTAVSKPQQPTPKSRAPAPKVQAAPPKQQDVVARVQAIACKPQPSVVRRVVNVVPKPSPAAAYVPKIKMKPAVPVNAPPGLRKPAVVAASFARPVVPVVSKARKMATPAAQPSGVRVSADRKGKEAEKENVAKLPDKVKKPEWVGVAGGLESTDSSLTQSPSIQSDAFHPISPKGGVEGQWLSSLERQMGLLKHEVKALRSPGKVEARTEVKVVKRQLITKHPSSENAKAVADKEFLSKLELQMGGLKSQMRKLQLSPRVSAMKEKSVVVDQLISHDIEPSNVLEKKPEKSTPQLKSPASKVGNISKVAAAKGNVVVSCPPRAKAGKGPAFRAVPGAGVKAQVSVYSGEYLSSFVKPVLLSNKYFLDCESFEEIKAKRKAQREAQSKGLREFLKEKRIGDLHKSHSAPNTSSKSAMRSSPLKGNDDHALELYVVFPFRNIQYPVPNFPLLVIPGVRFNQRALS